MPGQPARGQRQKVRINKQIDRLGHDVSSEPDHYQPNEPREADDNSHIQLLAQIVTSLDDAVISKTLGGVITSWNKGAERIFGFKAQEAMGQNVAIIETPNDKDEIPHLLERMRNGERIDHYQAVRSRKDGKRVEVWLTVSPICDASGQILGISMVARDVTQARRAERGLLQLAAELQLRNSDLARSNQELDDFAYIASHDLKEPLRGIHNYATFLIEDYSDKLDGAGLSKLLTLRVLTERMYALIDSLLEYSRVGRVGLAIQKTNLSTLLETVIQTLHITLEEQQVQIQIPAPLPTIRCDSVRIGEVFRNLITNAIKYNDKPKKLIEIGYQQGSLTPSAAGAEHRLSKGASETVFWVRDNGIGIPKKHFDGIFRIFKRLHARDKFGGGTGVGLTIVKKIIERHHGRIWLESTPGEGSTFYFTLADEEFDDGDYGSDPGRGR